MEELIKRLTERKKDFLDRPYTVFKDDSCFMNGYCEARTKDTLFCENKGCNAAKDRTCPYLMVIDRLADYEDTGLTPEDIKMLVTELKDERYRHDRPQDFEVAEAQELARVKKERDAAVLPCKMGDLVWCLSYTIRGLRVKEGIVSQMFYGEKMELCICVSGLCRGFWGENIFATKEEAEAKLLVVQEAE